MVVAEFDYLLNLDLSCSNAQKKYESPVLSADTLEQHPNDEDTENSVLKDSDTGPIPADVASLCLGEGATHTVVVAVDTFQQVTEVCGRFSCRLAHITQPESTAADRPRTSSIEELLTEMETAES